ncbi:hypothetical protein O7606_26250 [Micromonospora sp. WMMD882]|uniref:hypothetical protein n=1 Tax=Micromonospora sp. WMMD882 TaxID=3015151 RepID=UPI00248D20F2|nr:hypothetical protein [Micromonospora sp. WMMD882]WBB79604.1 hypothetical protein O7606_26250 [Micromonospora sp. WMMD882]
MAETERRRRRLRHPSPGPERPRAGAATATGGAPDAPAAAVRRGGPEERDSGGDRGLRGLVGSGTSQVSVTAALRARDASQPTGADLAEAETRLVLVRRNWVPREELPRPHR